MVGARVIGVRVRSLGSSIDPQAACSNASVQSGQRARSKALNINEIACASLRIFFLS